MEASAEQSQIEQLSRQANLIVDAVPGSGKTHCCLYIAAQSPHRRHLLLTYNAGLKHETRMKAALKNLRNIEIHSFHSACHKYYLHPCTNDEVIERALSENARPIEPLLYDTIMIDEAQDITMLFFKFIVKIIVDSIPRDGIPPRICVFGDTYQEIYGFKGADSRYLSMFDAVFARMGIEFVRASLTTSFRMPQEIAEFINYGLLRGRRPIATNRQAGVLPHYYVVDIFRYRQVWHNIIEPIARIWCPDQIFVLAKSTANPTMQRLVEYVSRYVPVYCTGGDMRMEEDLINGKLCFSTFHQSKGLERPVVIIIGVDRFGWPHADCPNELYVGASRASQRLILLHHKSNDFAPFINMSDKYLQIFDMRCLNVRQDATIFGAKHTESTVTAYIKYVPASVLNHLRFVEICGDKSYQISLPHKIAQPSGLIESVADLNGIAIPSYFEWWLSGDCLLANEIDDTDTISANVKDINVEKNINCVFLRLAAKYAGRHRKRQLAAYNWIGDDVFVECRNRLSRVIGGAHDAATICFEVPIYCEFLAISGRMDCIVMSRNRYIIYEIKCCRITHEHKLQLAIYLLMKMLNDEKNNENNVWVGRLYDVLSDTIVELNATKEELFEMIELVKLAKNPQRLNNVDFVLNGWQIIDNLLHTNEVAAEDGLAEIIVEDDGQH